MTAMTAVIAKPMGLLLFWLYEFVGNYGLTLIIFTVLVKMALFPLTVDQLKQSKKMTDIQPKVLSLQKKYGSDKETLNAKMLELYQEEGVNPARGCLPMLIQFPIIIGLFSLLRNPVAYVTEPGMLLAIHEAFLWVPDLSQPDKWILPILAGISTYFSFKMTSSAPGMDGNPSMKMMQYIFPLMIIFMGRSFPAGLTIYWFIGTVVQIAQQKVVNRKKASDRVKEED